MMAETAMTKLEEILRNEIIASVKFEIARQVQAIVAETVRNTIKDKQRELEKLAALTVAELLQELREEGK
jgi:hypothetical protein